VSRFGQNPFTRNDRKAGVKRLFFYAEPKPLESQLKDCQFLYVVDIDQNELYDLQADTGGIVKRLAPDISAILEHCKKTFKGVIYNSGGFIIINLFNDVRPIEKLRLKGTQNEKL
jgi:hypothetical protein